MAIKEDEKLTQMPDTDYEPVQSKSEETEELKEFEGDIVSALVEASKYRQEETEIYTMRIIRNKQVLLKFRIHPLSEQDYEACRRKNTKYVRNRNVGVKVPESTNAPRFRSQIIFTATVKEDRDKIWNNKDAWEKIGVASGVDMVDAILKAGEKDAIIEQIDKISGYRSSLEEATKN